MIYWSIIPVETAFAGYDDPSVQPKLVEIEHQGVTMIVEHIEFSQVKIHRLLSPRASDYLKAEWSPGQTIKL